METKARHIWISLQTMGCRIIIYLVAFLFFSSSLHAFSPKVHVYIGLKIIDQLRDNPGSIELDGAVFPADPQACNAISKWPGYFLAGTIGPDCYPDMVFGQSKIHPDLRCDYANNKSDGDCVVDTAEKTWTDDWLRHLWNMAHNETEGQAKEQAIAFVLGYFSHAAGDMWCHTFVNQYARGCWPADFTSGANRDIVIRHIITEGIISDHTPSIKGRLFSTTNPRGIKIKAPIPFLKRAFVDNDWAVAHGKGTFIGNFVALRKRLIEIQPSQPQVTSQWISRVMLNPLAVSESPGMAKDWLLHGYIDCWTRKIDEGLEDWLETSSKIAIDMLVDENSRRIWDDDLRPFMQNDAGNMLVKDPINIISACISIPDIPGWVLVVLNPVDFLNEQVANINNQMADIINPLNVMADQSCDMFFNTALGMPLDEYIKYYTSWETHAPNFLGEINTLEILLLLDIQRRGEMNDETCAVVYNTIVLNKLILLNTENLDRLLFHYNVGNLYSRPGAPPNVMLGFLKSIDGNHQWRKHAPSRDIYEANRSFGVGMPLWTDCLARKNFFEKVFKDWTSTGVSMLYSDTSEPCISISSPPSSAF